MRKLLVALGCALALTVAGCAASTTESTTVNNAGSTSGASGGSAEAPTGDPSLCPAKFGSPDTAIADSKRLPDITLDCLTADKKLKLDGAPGVPMVVNFWASWCAPCRTEMPILQQFYTAAAGKVLVLGIVSSDTRDSGTEFAAEEHVTFPNLFDKSGTVVKELGLTGLPNSLLINAKGKIVDKHVGPFTDGADLRATVKKELGVDIA